MKYEKHMPEKMIVNITLHSTRETNQRLQINPSDLRALVATYHFPDKPISRIGQSKHWYSRFEFFIETYEYMSFQNA